MKETPKYLVIPQKILADRELTTTEKVILAIMEQFPEANYKEVAEYTGISPRQLYTYRKRLQSKIEEKR